MKTADIILIALIALLAAAAVWFIIKRRKKGLCSCGGECANCMQACRKKDKEQSK